MSITQIIGFSLLICITLAYNETFSPFDLNTNVITTFVPYPGYEQNVAPKNYNIDGEIPEEEQSHKRPHAGCDSSFENRGEYRKRKKTHDDDDHTTQYIHHTSDIVLCQKTYDDLETLFGHNGDVTYNSKSEKITGNDREQMTITTSDDQSQEITDGFAYNIERENTDRELLGINVDKDLFPELICSLSPFNSDTSTSNIDGESPGTNGKKSELMSVIMSDVLCARTVPKKIENTRKPTANHLFTNVKNPIVEKSTISQGPFEGTSKEMLRKF
uniref:Uncharacterized protein n=1 Tax=Loa loa TaxID=7209 RepID=A0A1I7VBJ4_LOALO